MDLNLNGVLVSSEHPKELAEFYQKVFDIEPGWSGGEFVGWKVGKGYFTVGPHSDVKGKNDTPGRIMLFLETKNVEGEYKRIMEVGAKNVQEPYHPEEAGEMWLATLEDPDGNYFQLSSPMDEMPK